MKLRWKILIAAGIVFVLMTASLMVTLHVQPQSELEAYKKLLRDRGEKLEIAEVLPPSIPDESNGVALVESAFSLLVNGNNDYSNLPPAMRMVAPGKAMIGYEQTNLIVYGLGGFTNTWENAEIEAAANLPAIGLLSQAASYPAIDFHLDYAKGPEIPLKYLAPFKRCAQGLSATAMCDLHEGDTAAAATNICVLLALVQGEHDERPLISQLVRIAMASLAMSASWELLQSTNLADPELAALQKSWEQQEFIEGMENSFLMERASTITTIETMRADVGKFNLYMGTSSSGSGSSGSGDWAEDLQNLWDGSKESGAILAWRISWSYSDELAMLQKNQIILETMRTIRTNQFFNPAYTNMLSRLNLMVTTDALDDWLTRIDLSDYRRVFSESAGGLSHTVQRTMAAEVCKRVTVTAIALKRFELKHGRLPEKLSELTPEFVAAVPLDPVDGAPLRYRRNPDGTFLLYSVGPDGVDDGGDPTVPAGSGSSLGWQNYKALDWVWPQPASPAEVRDFYEHPPK